MSFRRMLPFLLLNVFVSAAVVLTILWWDGRESQREIAAAVAAPAPSLETPLPAAADLPVTEATPAGGEEETTSSERPGVHVVRAGETLGQISLQYDITVDEIMSANGIDNPNFLSVGQELVIPEEGAAPPEPEATSEAAESTGNDQPPTPIPTEPATEGESLLAIADVIGPGQLSLEAITIVNNGSREAALNNWKLTDQLGNTYTFGQLTLFGDGAGISLHTGSGQDSATDLFWGLEEAVWNSGDRVVLYDDAGTIRAEFEVP
jgi:LysM repeat protein